MITVVQQDNVYIITFQYNKDVIDIVKNVPGRTWVPEKKYWTIPVDRLGFFLAQLQGTPYESLVKLYSSEKINQNATLDATTKDSIPDIDLSKIPLYVHEGDHLFSHQLDFMKYAIDRHNKGLYSGFLLADEMGAGKSLQAMNLALYKKKYQKIKHCLIVACVNSAKFNWVEDIEKHTNGEYHPYILGSRLKRDGTIKYGVGKEKLEDLMCGHMYGKKDCPPLPFFIILNIEAFHMRVNRRYLIRERLATLVNKGYIGMIILDEVHKNCLDYDTLITTDIGLLKIGDVVRDKMHVNTLSYNEFTNRLEWCPVVDWIETTTDTSLIELVIETPTGIKTIRCTPNHKFYTKNRGWVAAEDLRSTDDIVCN